MTRPPRLTPEHVGTRVLLSDSTVHFILGVTDTHYLLTEAGKPFSLIKTDSLDDDITLLLDAPNPLDVELPEWCRWVIGWRVFDAAPPHLIPAIHGSADFPHDVFGWSPAPGQMPRREDV